MRNKANHEKISVEIRYFKILFNCLQNRFLVKGLKEKGRDSTCCELGEITL